MTPIQDRLTAIVPPMLMPTIGLVRYIYYVTLRYIIVGWLVEHKLSFDCSIRWYQMMVESRDIKRERETEEYWVK